MSASTERPVTLLIAALAARAAVCHRLDRVGGRASRPAGAVDLDPGRRSAHRRDDLLHEISDALSRAWRQRPVLALSPGAGDVDVVVASELLEAGRAIAMGFVTTDRTLLLSSTSRAISRSRRCDGRRTL